jgi:uncharacterized membrane protein
MEWLQIGERWVHFLAGITWIGLLYYFNMVQAPALAAAAKDTGGPGGAGIAKYVLPRALLWFRWAAVVTWLAGAGLLSQKFGFMQAFTLQEGAAVIGIGAWLGTIMLLIVWGIIWPNQKKVLGLKTATDEEKAKARRTAFLASRTNVMLSIPMLFFMAAGGHGQSLFL